MIVHLHKCWQRCLTQCKRDMVTHPQQLSKTHWASLLVYTQLCHPDRERECTQRQSWHKNIATLSQYERVKVMCTVHSDSRDSTTQCYIHILPWNCMSDWLFIVRCHNEPISLSMLGNQVQHDVQRAVITAVIKCRMYKKKHSENIATHENVQATQKHIL